jgi:hypothetical protein
MAAAPLPIISVGDFVKTAGRVCYVENIDRSLGFGQYILVDIDSGVVLKKSRYELEPIHVDIVTGNDGDMDFENIDIQTLSQPNEDRKSSKTEGNRFATICEEDLDKIALNRTSKNTRNQTSWGVSIFKGETLIKISMFTNLNSPPM